MENIPAYVSIVFVLTTFLAVMLFYMANSRSFVAIVLVTLWLIVQGLVSLGGFYTVTDAFPPRFVLLVLPPLVFIAILFFTGAGRRYVDGLNPAVLTVLHIVRIPIELVLYWLFLNKAVPRLMTFAGRNFDILAGLSAPLIYYFGFSKRLIGRKMILLWNFICLGLLVNIVVNALLSAPFPFQQFGFSQPNIAVLYFPYVWLPCCVVPLVLLSHLAVIRQLWKRPVGSSPAALPLRKK
jgi:hypothetical protein